MKRKVIFILTITLIVVLSGCNTNVVNVEDLSDNTEVIIEKEIVNQETSTLTEKAVEVNKEKKEQIIFPENDTGKTQIHVISNNEVYPYNSYLIVTSDNKKVMLDPTKMPKIEDLVVSPNIIVSTHDHNDHRDKIFNESYPEARVLVPQDKEYSEEGIKITLIPASHNGDYIRPDYPNNLLVVVDVDGLRIVHMGDTGQSFITDEQLELLGDVDIAFTQFENGYSSMTVKNMKGFNLIEQVNPRIIIPTHFHDDALNLLEEKYGEFTVVDDVLTISKHELPEENLNVYRIINNFLYKK